MVLYCCQHSANIIRAIVHKFKYHRNDKAFIIVDKGIHTQYCPDIEDIAYYQMPDYVDIVRYSPDSEEKIKAHTQETLKNFLENINFNTNSFSAIYALFDIYNPFTLYFEMNSIEYNIIEMNDNWLYQYTSYDIRKGRPDSEYAYNSLIVEMHLQDGAGKYCKKVYLNSNNSKIPKDVKQHEVFDFFENLLSIDDTAKTQLIQAYSLKDFLADNCYLVLLNSPMFTFHIFRHTSSMNFPVKYQNGYKQYGYFYSVICDYYLGNTNFTLKLHPESSEAFSEVFSEQKQVPYTVPIELFLLLPHSDYRVFCPIQSTACDGFRRAGFHVTSLGMSVAIFFPFLHFVGLAFRFIERLSIPDQIYVYGLDIQQLNHFRDYAHPSFATVQFVQLTAQNAPEAEFIVAVPDPAFYTVTKSASNNAVIVTNQQASIEGYRQILMKCSVVDISESKNNAIQEFEWSVHANAGNICQIASCFFAAYILKNAKIKIQSKPSVPVLVNTDNTHNDIESLKAVLEGKIDRMMEFLLNPSEVAIKMSRIQDFSEYLGWLDVLKYKYVILFSVKDTPGSALPNHLVQSIRDLGFSEFTKDLWTMYAGMTGKGHVIANRRGANREDPVEIQYVDMNSGTEYILRSQAWKKGNKAEILINGQDYAANIRGINIVVYDPESQTVIDSIGFDHHEPRSRFVRKER